MQEVAEYVSPVERALAGWLLERPVSIPRLPVALLSREQKAAELQRVQMRNPPGLTVRKLKDRALALLQEADADAIDGRRQQAERHADVRLHDCPFDGTATLAADLPADVAAACHAVVDALARTLKADGDPRPIGQLRTLVYADLLQRPWESGRPAVTAHLQVIATLSALAGRSTEAGQVNGLPITAAHLRELLTQLDALGLRVPEGGSVTLALVDDDGALRATTTLDRLRRLARLDCPDHRDTDAAPAACPPAASASGGPTPTTSSRTPTAAPPTAPTCAACAAATTASRPSRRAGASR
ncbi:hypothetical protein ACI796_00250 [Geodermatophilus sp. SYSU D00525]